MKIVELSQQQRVDAAMRKIHQERFEADLRVKDRNGWIFFAIFVIVCLVAMCLCAINAMAAEEADQALFAKERVMMDLSVPHR